MEPSYDVPEVCAALLHAVRLQEAAFWSRELVASGLAHGRREAGTHEGRWALVDLSGVVGADRMAGVTVASRRGTDGHRLLELWGQKRHTQCSKLNRCSRNVGAARRTLTLPQHCGKV